MEVYPKPLIFIFQSFCIASLIPSFTSVPFAVFYGLGEVCSSPNVANLIDHLSNLSHSQGYCIETDAEIGQSKQVEIACSKIKSIPALSEGYNIVALSQGNRVARGVVELCDGAPPVKKLVGLAGPLAGLASTPHCGSEDTCSFIDYLLHLEIYCNVNQKKLASSNNFIGISPEMEEYLKFCEFRPLLSNELAAKTNSTYKERVSTLEKLVIIMFANDTVMVPRKASWFGSISKVLPYSENKMYKEEWLPLKALDDAGKIEFVSVPGMHLEMSINYIVPYLKDESFNKGRLQRLSLATVLSSIWK